LRTPERSELNPFESKVALPPRMTDRPEESMLAAVWRVPPLRAKNPEPKVLISLMLRIPALRVVEPVWSLLMSVSVKVPLPFLVIPPPPVIRPETVVEKLLVPSTNCGPRLKEPAPSMDPTVTAEAEGPVRFKLPPLLLITRDVPPSAVWSNWRFPPLLLVRVADPALEELVNNRYPLLAILEFPPV